MKKIKTAGIIGYGSFGKFLSDLAKKYFPDVQVKIFSTSQKIDNKKFFDFNEVVKSDILFPAVPIKNIPESFEKISQKVGENTILIDIATIKEFPENELKKYPHIKYVCTHPMFGLFSYKKIGDKLDNLRVVLTSSNLEKKELELFKEILKKLKLNIVEMSSEEHDKKLARTLFLTHFIAQAVNCAGYKRTDIDTISFGFLMNAVESVKSDTELFKDIYKYNKYCKNIIENFNKTTLKVSDELKGVSL